MAKKCARTFSIVVEKGKKSILDVTHLLPDALPRSVRQRRLQTRSAVSGGPISAASGSRETSKCVRFVTIPARRLQHSYTGGAHSKPTIGRCVLLGRSAR